MYHKPLLFVLMPFGVREVSLDSGRPTMDFDDFYRSLIRPAAEAVGWNAQRADEITKPGPIMNSVYEQLVKADAVLADLTSVNGNVLYELGIWNALMTCPTFLIARQGTYIPFDIVQFRVLMYEDQHEPTIRNQIRQDLETGLRYMLTERGTSFGNPVEQALKVSAVRPAGGSLDADKEFALRVERANNIEQLMAV